MPEFILNTTGKAYRSVSETSLEAVRWPDLDVFTQGYIEALFFTEEESLREAASELRSADIDGGRADFALGFSDLAPEALARIIDDCAAFQKSDAWRAFEAWRDDDDSPDTTPADDEQAGRDFWFTRNGHGVGFWDRPGYFYGPHTDKLSELARKTGEIDVYLGDDGKVHLS